MSAFRETRRSMDCFYARGPRETTETHIPSCDETRFDQRRLCDEICLAEWVNMKTEHRIYLSTLKTYFYFHTSPAGWRKDVFLSSFRAVGMFFFLSVSQQIVAVWFNIDEHVRVLRASWAGLIFWGVLFFINKISSELGFYWCILWI